MIPARVVGTAMGEAVLGAVAAGGVLGAIATGQWLVLRRRSPWADWWVPATLAAGLVGGAIALGVLDLLSANGREALGGIVGSLAGLSAFGIVQWLILRRVTQAGWWTLASVVGLVAAGPLGVGVLGFLVGDGAGFGAVYGAITGARFVTANRRRPATAPGARARPGQGPREPRHGGRRIMARTAAPGGRPPPPQPRREPETSQA
ncbi:hypothetical protein [Candidatus Palauibacter sp.]|uniref:hypothetical protein n=1 Tax=Candidatus Palauibacter sp. TaxID=3101350 RepID=UPI003B5AF76D